MDADYVSNKVGDRKSFSGEGIMCGGECILWFSRKQKYGTLSTTKTKYVAVADVLKKVLFLRWRLMLPEVD